MTMPEQGQVYGGMQRRPRPQPGGGQQNPYNYQNFTKFTQGIQANPNQYEQDVLGGKYLDIKNNPYLQGYQNSLQENWKRALGETLSQAASPFMSGATLGQTGMLGAQQGRIGNVALNDLSQNIGKMNLDAYTFERGQMGDVNQGLSGRTNQLVSGAASAYGADRQVQSTRIQANAMLQQARMAQQLGYDKLAADMVMQAEQMNQQAAQQEYMNAMGYGNMVSNIEGGFGQNTSSGTQTQQGPRQSALSGFLQGGAGGVMTGLGIGSMFGGGGGGGGQGTYFNANPAGSYFNNFFGGNAGAGMPPAGYAGPY